MEKKPKEGLANIFWLLTIVFKYVKLPFLLSASLQVLNALAPVALAASIGGLVGILTNQEPSWSTIWPWIAIILLAHLLQQSYVITSYKDYLYQQRLEKTFDEPILKKMGELPMKYFEDPSTHDLFARTINPSERIQNICEEILHTMGSWLQMIFLVLYIGNMFWWMGPLFLIFSLIITKFELSIGKRMQAKNRELSVPEREKEYLGNLMTDRNSAMELKLFALGSHLIERWKKWFALIQKDRLRFDLKMLIPVILLQITQGIIIFGSVLLLIWQIRQGGGGIAIFSSSVVALLSFLEAVGNISWNARNLGEGNDYLGEVQELLNIPTDNSDPGELPFPTTMKEGIRFERVTFSYDEEGPPVLHDVSFRIQPGEKIALVGANGSGKSTLMKLLLGLYKPDAGKIYIDGVDLREIEPKSRQQAMSVVFQEFGKYSLSIQENIALGQIEQINDDYAVREAAIAGDAHPFIDVLPEKYHTPLGRLKENGHEPSGGQWQKLAVSRSLFRKAQILIFDEPAAALDPLAEVKLYDHIHHVLKGQTSVLVTHRLGSVHTCDRIIVLDHGKVVETGTHESLMKQGAIYAEMYASQADWYQEVKI